MKVVARSVFLFATLGQRYALEFCSDRGSSAKSLKSPDSIGSGRYFGEIG